MIAFISENEVALHYIGLMSGTSLDGVDGVLLTFSPSNHLLETRAACHIEMPPHLREVLLALNTSGGDELHRASLCANALMMLYAQAVEKLLERSSLERAHIKAIGAHGQTVRHQPQAQQTPDGDPCVGYTIQLHNAALLAELTGISVVTDFRSRDLVAGGQGAPLVPPFHAALFAERDEFRAVVNIGGIANVTYLPPVNSGLAVIGFDTGPGNMLLDYWCQQHTGKNFDQNGDWARSGVLIPELLSVMLADDYFVRSYPKSTGRDEFNGEWLSAILRKTKSQASWPSRQSYQPQDVQATLTELTAQSIAQAWQSVVGTGVTSASQMIVCGGGALNQFLCERLSHHVFPCQVVSSAQYGMAPLSVEAAAFAWLAKQCMEGKSANLPHVTGAVGARILGAIYQY